MNKPLQIFPHEYGFKLVHTHNILYFTPAEANELLRQLLVAIHKDVKVEEP